ncbi:MAG: hypothetical protein E7080_09800 [Bacteroidales bacterium]|nr:hypothetical protein [Bacteroidales bacterium]
MQILVNGKIASIKKGSSFEFVSENRFFTDSDGYSLSITFPLAGCPENIAIFGHLNRKDVDNPKMTLDCEICDIHFLKSGAITITDLNETEVKAQFLEGRSAQNFDVTWDDVYINELDLGEPASLSPPSQPYTAWQGLIYGQEYVALPWVNNSSTNIQNEVVKENNSTRWGDDVEGLSFFPYLIVIAKRICEAVGYEYDFSEWENDEEKRFLLVCNALPYAWDIPQFARALPHWTVTDFFEKLEPFLAGEFDINHKSKIVSFTFYKTILAGKNDVLLNRVVDSFSSEVSSKEECEYKGSATLKYKECGHHMQKFYSCDWFVAEQRDSIVEYDTLKELIEANEKYRVITSSGRNSTHKRVLYAKDVDRFYVIRVFLYSPIGSFPDSFFPYTILQPINVFGDDVVIEDTDNEIEIEFVPVCIDIDDEKGYLLFLDLPSYDETEIEMNSGGLSSNSFQTLPVQLLSAGEKESRAEYFDVINIGFWDGSNYNLLNSPIPAIDSIMIREDWTLAHTHFSMRLKDLRIQSPQIDSQQKYTFSFLYDGVPDVRSVFYINGKKYLCEKITSTFSENGMSQLKIGVFYRIVDEN